MSPSKFEVFSIFPKLFYLWRTGPVLKHCKLPKYYDQDCLKIFILLSTLPKTIAISGKGAHLA